MARLIYAAMASLDGYIEDAQGKFDWAEPDAEVRTFINGIERPIGTYLYGRRLYETMVVWEDSSAFAGEPAHIQEFARIWQAAEKVVYSRTLERASSGRTRIERDFDADAVRQMKARSEHDMVVGGAELASRAIDAGLVDEYHVFVAPVVVGGGKQALPDDVRLTLELLDERRFGNGMVYLHYRVRA